MSGHSAPGMDLNDVPPVAPADLWLVMRVMVEAERGLLLINGASKTDRARIEAEFWQEFDGSTAQGVATLIRFWCLVDVFQSRRLRGHLMLRGYEIFYPLAEAAARLRLSFDWGFNPQRLIWAIGLNQPVALSAESRLPRVEAVEVSMAA